MVRIILFVLVVDWDIQVVYYSGIYSKVAWLLVLNIWRIIPYALISFW